MASTRLQRASSGFIGVLLIEAVVIAISWGYIQSIKKIYEEGSKDFKDIIFVVIGSLFFIVIPLYVAVNVP
jgi:hypothetical protein